MMTMAMVPVTVRVMVAWIVLDCSTRLLSMVMMVMVVMMMMTMAMADGHGNRDRNGDPGGGGDGDGEGDVMIVTIIISAVIFGHCHQWCLSTGSISFRMLAGLCLIIAQHEYWQCLVSDAGWILLDCSTSLIGTGRMLPGW